jgi:hypothetical protein
MMLFPLVALFFGLVQAETARVSDSGPAAQVGGVQENIGSFLKKCPDRAEAREYRLKYLRILSGILDDVQNQWSFRLDLASLAPVTLGEDLTCKRKNQLKFALEARETQKNETLNDLKAFNTLEIGTVIEFLKVFNSDSLLFCHDHCSSFSEASALCPDRCGLSEERERQAYSKLKNEKLNALRPWNKVNCDMDVEFKEDVLHSTYKGSHRDLFEAIEKLKASAERTTERSATYVAKLDRDIEKIRSELKKFPNPQKCNSELSELLGEIEGATVSQNNGTVFYAQTISSLAAPVSAEHVFPVNSRGSSTRFENGMWPFTRSGEFPNTPGHVDVDQDVVVGKLSKRGQALKVVGPNQEPVRNQEFVLAGFPGIRKGAFTSFRCYFDGYSESKIELVDRDTPSRSPQYVLRCPTLENHLGGMSGGPMVDRDGKVWGVITAGSLKGATAFVSPIYKDSTNRIQTGFAKPILSKDCLRYSSTSWTVDRYECHVFNGSRSPDVP